MTEIIIEKTFIKSLLPERKENSHKGVFGSILNISGSLNYRGAAFLSTISALKSGAGYIALASIKEVINSVSILCPEAVFIPLKEKNGTIKSIEYKKILEILPKYKVLSLGCGISSLNENQTEIETFTKNLLNALQKVKIPVVIDADGLNIISKLNIKTLPENTVLTPHPTELSRLLNIDVDEIQKERIKYVKMASQKYKSTVVLKGHNTVISNGNAVYINPTGNSSLAKAGSGDILTGIISGFCAQGVPPFEASILGVYIHGLAGEISSKNLTEYSVNASDLIRFIPNTIKEIIEKF